MGRDRKNNSDAMPYTVSFKQRSKDEFLSSEDSRQRYERMLASIINTVPRATSNAGVVCQ